MTAVVDEAQLVTSVLGLVKRIAREIHRKTGADYEEMVADGHLGALLAARSFDTSYENTFATYAAHRIRGEILDGLRQRDHLSRSQRKAADVDDDRWKPPAFLDAPLADTGVTLGETLPALDEAFDDVLADIEAAHWAIAQLDGIQHDVVVRHYWDGTPLHEIGALHGFTESRASQIEGDAVHRMRVAFLRAGFDLVAVTDRVANVARRKGVRMSAAEHGAMFDNVLSFWESE